MKVIELVEGDSYPLQLKFPGSKPGDEYRIDVRWMKEGSDIITSDIMAVKIVKGLEPNEE